MSGVDDEPEVIIITSQNKIFSGHPGLFHLLKGIADIEWHKMQVSKIFMTKEDYDDILKLDK